MTTGSVEGRRPQGQLELFKALAADISMTGIAVQEPSGGVKSQGFTIECMTPHTGKRFEDKATLQFTDRQPRAGIQHPSLALTIISFKPLGFEKQFAGQVLRETQARGVILLPDDNLVTFQQQTFDEVWETDIFHWPGRNPVASPVTQGEKPGIILLEMDQLAPAPSWCNDNMVREPILL